MSRPDNHKYFQSPKLSSDLYIWQLVNIWILFSLYTHPKTPFCEDLNSYSWPSLFINFKHSSSKLTKIVTWNDILSKPQLALINKLLAEASLLYSKVT